MVPLLEKERLPCLFWWAFWEGGGALVGSSVFLKTFELYHLNLTAVWDSSRHCNTSSHIYLTSSSGCWLHFEPLPACPRLWVSMIQYPVAEVLGFPPRSSGEQHGFASRLIVFVHTLCSCSHTPCSGTLFPLKTPHMKLQRVLCNLSVCTVRVQMTGAAPSSPPAVNSLRLDPDNHLLSV